MKSWREMRDWSAATARCRAGYPDGAPGTSGWPRGPATSGPGGSLASAASPATPRPCWCWERFGYPDFMTADSGELIDGQYADRPQLRPILDAVLGLLPALGPATVQARKTIISLVSPRRTFAVVRATTKDRVDLGLRLDDAEPGGRLQSAKNIGGGGATVRVALRRPEDVDDEVRDLMRRAYDENTAPPPPRRPARRPGAMVGTMIVVIEGSELPGRTCRPEPGGPGHRERLRRAGRQKRGPSRADHVEQARDGHRAGARGRARGPLGDAGHGQARRGRLRLRRAVRARRPR